MNKNQQRSAAMYRLAIKECIEAGMTNHEAAKALGMSIGTYGKYKMINGFGEGKTKPKSKRKFSRVVLRNAEKERDEMESYVERGLSIGQIAIETGRNRSTIKNCIEILGLNPSPSGIVGGGCTKPKEKPKSKLITRIMKFIFGRFANE